MADDNADKGLPPGIEALRQRLEKYRGALSHESFSSAVRLVLETLDEVHFGAFVEGYSNSIVEALQRLEQAQQDTGAKALGEELLNVLPSELPARPKRPEDWPRVRRRNRESHDLGGPTPEVMPNQPAGPRTLAVIPLRNLVAVPQMSIPLAVGRPKSVRAVEEAIRCGAFVLCNQRDGAIEDPEPDELHDVGVLARVLKAVQVSDNNLSVLVEAGARVRILRYLPNDDFLLCEAIELEELDPHAETARLMDDVRDALRALGPVLPTDAITSLVARTDASGLADATAAWLPLDLEEKQRLLETIDVTQRLKILLQHLREWRQHFERQRRIRQQAAGVLRARPQSPTLRDPRYEAQRNAVRRAFDGAEKQGFEDGYLLGLSQAIEALDDNQASVEVIEKVIASVARAKR